MRLVHIMLDLETLGVVPGCVGFSIGAVEFHPERNELGSEFYVVIDVESCRDHYLREEEGTKTWWAKQSPEARTALEHALSGNALRLVNAMVQFDDWLRGLTNDRRNIRLYGNGADFDNPILACMYDASGVSPFLPAWGGRCYRTLKNLHELLGDAYAAPKLERQGTYHNALDDAKSQATHLMEIVAAIRNTHSDELKQGD